MTLSEWIYEPAVDNANRGSYIPYIEAAALHADSQPHQSDSSKYRNLEQWHQQSPMRCLSGRRGKSRTLQKSVKDGKDMSSGRNIPRNRSKLPIS